MTIIYYLYLLVPFVVLFASGYFPVVLLGRLLTKQRVLDLSDVYAPFAGGLGTAVGFLFVGLNGLDRFALAPDRVRTAWQSSGAASSYELMQGLFSGLVCGLFVLMIARFWPGFALHSRIATPVLALLLSIVDFIFWPVFFSPFL